MKEQTQHEAARMALLAGVRVPDGRIAALAAGLELTKRIAMMLAAVDYGETEPASRFGAPAPDDR